MSTDLNGLSTEETNPQPNDLVLIERPGVESRKMKWSTVISETSSTADDHIADTTAAHAASAISASAGTTLTGDDVAEQLAQADVSIGTNATAISDHIASSSAHAASCNITRASHGLPMAMACSCRSWRLCWPHRNISRAASL